MSQKSWKYNIRRNVNLDFSIVTMRKVHLIATVAIALAIALDYNSFINVNRFVNRTEKGRINGLASLFLNSRNIREPYHLQLNTRT